MSLPREIEDAISTVSVKVRDSESILHRRGTH